MENEKIILEQVLPSEIEKPEALRSLDSELEQSGVCPKAI